MQNSVFSGLYLELQRAMPNRWLGVVVAALLVATIATVVMAMPDQYESRSRMYINSEVVLRPLLRGIASEEDAESREDLLKVLQTTVLNTNNIDRLLEIPDLGFDLSTEDRRNKARMIRNGVTIAEQKTRNLFDLAYTDTDPPAPQRPPGAARGHDRIEDGPGAEGLRRRAQVPRRADRGVRAATSRA
jgi:uncharacterized protein involved in exopolysaccharide biosynthesis